MATLLTPLPASLAFVAFDFDGTLTDFVAADRSALECLRRAACPAVPPQEFEEQAVDEIMAFHARVQSSQADPLRQDEERIGRTLSAFGVTFTPGFLTLYSRALREATRPLPGAAALLTSLRSRGLKLALLSNAYDGLAQRARLQSCFPGQPFDVVVIAGETGELKPHPRPFQAMLSALNLPASVGVYVGDSPAHDVVGAQAAGLRPFLVHPHPRVQERGRQLGAAVFGDLAAVQGWFDSGQVTLSLPGRPPVP